MPIYKVCFENNKATTADEVEVIGRDNPAEFGMEGKKRFIRTLHVDAASGKLAMQMADYLAKKVWGDILGL
jgi:hypothetical protein